MNLAPPACAATSGGASLPSLNPLSDPLAPDVSKPPVAPLRRLVTMDPRTGGPVLSTVPLLTKQAVQDVTLAALSDGYQGPEPEYAGWTNVEVIQHKRARAASLTGDPVDGEALLDRAIGKPKTTSENFNRNVSYEAKLLEIEERERREAIDAEVVAEPTGPSLETRDPLS